MGTSYWILVQYQKWQVASGGWNDGAPDYENGVGAQIFDFLYYNENIERLKKGIPYTIPPKKSLRDEEYPTLSTEKGTSVASVLWSIGLARNDIKIPFYRKFEYFLINSEFQYVIDLDQQMLRIFGHCPVGSCSYTSPKYYGRPIATFGFKELHDDIVTPGEFVRRMKKIMGSEDRKIEIKSDFTRVRKLLAELQNSVLSFH
jgi:hypothetical protein